MKENFRYREPKAPTMVPKTSTMVPNNPLKNLYCGLECRLNSIVCLKLLSLLLSICYISIILGTVLLQLYRFSLFVLLMF